MKLIFTLALLFPLAAPVQAQSAFDDLPDDETFATADVPYASSIDEEQAAARMQAERAAYAKAQSAYLAAAVVDMVDRVEGLSAELDQLKAVTEAQQRQLAELAQAQQEQAAAVAEVAAKAQASAPGSAAAVQNQGVSQEPVATGKRVDTASEPTEPREAGGPAE
jgi:hypothetical protein